MDTAPSQRRPSPATLEARPRLARTEPARGGILPGRTPGRWAGLVVAIVGGVACAPHPGQPAGGAAAPDVLRVDATVRIEVDTTLRRVAGRAPLADDDPVARAMAPLAHTGLDARLALELRPSRRFPDGSQGWTLRFVDAVGQVLGPSDDDPQGGLVAIGEATDWTLAGRSVELRGFPDGEILTVADAVHIMGPDRLGEGLDVLLPMLSPFPPALDEGEEGTRQARWPLMESPTRGWRHRFDGHWENLGLAAVDPGAGDARLAWHLRYRGATSTRGRDDRPFPPVGVQGRGTLQGEVWLSPEDEAPVVRRVLRNDATWVRQVEIEYPDAQGGPLRVVQSWRIEASVRRRWP